MNDNIVLASEVEDTFFVVRNLTAGNGCRRRLLGEGGRPPGPTHRHRAVDLLKKKQDNRKGPRPIDWGPFLPFLKVSSPRTQ